MHYKQLSIFIDTTIKMTTYEELEKLMRCETVTLDLDLVFNTNGYIDERYKMLFYNTKVKYLTLTRTKTTPMKIGINFMLFSQKLKSVTITNFKNVVEIDHCFMSNNYNLEFIKFDSLADVKTIGFSFLINCRNLTTLDISTLINVESIGDSFLSACLKLEYVNFPKFDSITKIGTNFLSSLIRLKNIDNIEFKNIKDFECNNMMTHLHSLEKLNFSMFENITKIKEISFFGLCVEELDVSMCKNITHVDTATFVYMKNIKKVICMSDKCKIYLHLKNIYPNVEFIFKQSDNVITSPSNNVITPPSNNVITPPVKESPKPQPKEDSKPQNVPKKCKPSKEETEDSPKPQQKDAPNILPPGEPWTTFAKEVNDILNGTSNCSNSNKPSNVHSSASAIFTMTPNKSGESFSSCSATANSNGKTTSQSNSNVTPDSNNTATEQSNNTTTGQSSTDSAKQTYVFTKDNWPPFDKKLYNIMGKLFEEIDTTLSMAHDTEKKAQKK